MPRRQISNPYRASTIAPAYTPKSGSPRFKPVWDHFDQRESVCEEDYFHPLSLFGGDYLIPILDITNTDIRHH